MRNGRLQFERRWNATGAALELDLTPLKRRSSKMRFLKCTNISVLQLRSEYYRRESVNLLNRRRMTGKLMNL